MKNNTSASRSTPRRSFLFAGLASLVTGLFCQRTAKAAGIKAAGEPVTTHLRQGEPPVQPLDTMLLFERPSDAVLQNMAERG